MIIYSKIITVILLGVLSVCDRNNPCLKLEIKHDQVYSSSDEKSITLVLTNKKSNEISLPEWLYQGRENDVNAEMWLKILKREANGTYVQVSEVDTDYDYMLIGRNYNSVRPNMAISYDIELDFLHKLNEKACYKMQIVLRLNKFIYCHEIESSWSEFEVR